MVFLGDFDAITLVFFGFGGPRTGTGIDSSDGLEQLERI